MNTKLVVSLTTISKRIIRVHEVIESISSQTRPPDEIHLFLSKENYLLDGGILEIPPELDGCIKKYNVNLHYVPNIGPYRKLLPLLRQTWGQDACIVTVDDDTIYPPHFLERMVLAFQNHQCIIAFSGRRITFNKEGGVIPYRRWPKLVNGQSKDILNFPIGKDGVLYHHRFFTDRVFDDAALTLCPTADDIWFRCNTWIKQVPACILGVDPGPYFPDIRFGAGGLWKTNARSNTECFRRVARHLKLPAPFAF